MDPLHFGPLDTSSCEDEPIRYPGAVQPHGAPLVVDQVGSTIFAASESFKVLIGLKTEELLGKALASTLDSEAKVTLLANHRNALQLPIDLEFNGRAFTARSLRNAIGQYLVDIEPSLSGNH